MDGRNIGEYKQEGQKKVDLIIFSTFFTIFVILSLETSFIKAEQMIGTRQADGLKWKCEVIEKETKRAIYKLIGRWKFPIDRGERQNPDPVVQKSMTEKANPCG